MTAKLQTQSNPATAWGRAAVQTVKILIRFKISQNGSSSQARTGLPQGDIFCGIQHARQQGSCIHRLNAEKQLHNLSPITRQFVLRGLAFYLPL